MLALRKLFRWERGRQKSGYDKMLICGAYWPVKFDTYLLRFPKGSEIKPHTDTVKSGKHYRLNIVLKSARVKCYLLNLKQSVVNFFRPDISERR